MKETITRSFDSNVPSLLSPQQTNLKSSIYKILMFCAFQSLLPTICIKVLLHFFGSSFISCSSSFLFSFRFCFFLDICFLKMEKCVLFLFWVLASLLILVTCYLVFLFISLTCFFVRILGIF